MDMSAPIEACASCGGRAHRFFAERNGCRLWRCQACGLVAMSPPPAPESIAALYEDPYHGGTESYFTKIESKMRRSRGRVQRLARHLKGDTKGKRFLDIGCNGGFMTEAAREQGFVATGLDPDAPSIAWAREHFPKNSYVHGFLEDADLGGVRFDAAYCSEVIEHAPDPDRFAMALAAALAPRGLLYITTPDIDHWRRPRELARWDAWNPPSHCVYFNPKNLKLLLAKHGLAPVWRAISFKPGIKMIVRKAG